MTTDTTTTTAQQTTPNGGAPAATQQASRALVPASPPDEGGSIDVFASQANFVAAQRMAKALASSSLVPQSYQGDAGVPNVLIAMELAARIGASVFAVIQNIDIIHGRPSWRATFLIATVNASGRFTPLRFRFEGKPGTPDFGCRATAKDKSDGEELIGALITMGLATAEGWATKSGSKWKTMPEQMLMYRAAAFWTRAYAPELALGMQTAEEARDVYGPTVEEMPAEIVPGNTRALQEAIMARGGAIDVTPEPVAQAVPAVPASEPKVEPVAAKPKAGKGKGAALPTGNLLPVEPERDPLTGEIVPPMREPDDGGEELT